MFIDRFIDWGTTTGGCKRSSCKTNQVPLLSAQSAYLLVTRVRGTAGLQCRLRQAELYSASVRLPRKIPRSLQRLARQRRSPHYRAGHRPTNQGQSPCRTIRFTRPFFIPLLHSCVSLLSSLECFSFSRYAYRTSLRLTQRNERNDTERKSIRFNSSKRRILRVIQIFFKFSSRRSYVNRFQSLNSILSTLKHVKRRTVYYHVLIFFFFYPTQRKFNLRFHHLSQLFFFFTFFSPYLLITFFFLLTITFKISTANFASTFSLCD